MNKKYKVISYEVPFKDNDINKNPWEIELHEIRFCVVDAITGEVLDDAQGFGYKTAANAYKAYAYKTRDKTKDKEKQQKRKEILAWMKKNRSFVRLMDDYAFLIAKGSMGPDDKFDAKFVQKLLDENDIKIDFKASELYNVWLKG